MSTSSWDRHKALIVELFVLSNFGFLVLDIWLAHSVNRFRHWGEWIPFWFSIGATVLLAPACLARWRNAHTGYCQGVGLLVGWSSILVGVWGLVFHLESQFFELWTLRSLVYTAPCVAPLSYAGLGFLLLMNRMVATSSREWGQWVVFLALGGFVGNFALTLADHAQNGFFHVTEWIPVVSSAFAIGFLVMALGRQSKSFLLVCLCVLALQAVVGVLGFYLHLVADVNGLSTSLFDNFLHGAPILAPLLFTNLFLLAAIGIGDGLLWAAR